MKLQRKISALVLVLMVSVLFLGLPTAVAEKTYELPYFRALYDGTTLPLADYPNKAFLLVYFTEASDDNTVVMPALKQVYERYSRDELQILMIHEWAAESAINTENVIYAYGLEELEGIAYYEDTDMSVGRAINLPDVPFVIFMDQYGYMHDAYRFATTFELMEEVLDSMGITKAEPPVPTEAPEEANAAAPVNTPALTPLPTTGN